VGAKDQRGRVVALAAHIWGWPEGEAGGANSAARVHFSRPVALPRVERMADRAWRTAMHAPIAVVDRISQVTAPCFYEMRIYGAEWRVLGRVHRSACRGSPRSAVCGHSRYISIAMTTGGPRYLRRLRRRKSRDGTYHSAAAWRPGSRLMRAGVTS